LHEPPLPSTNLLRNFTGGQSSCRAENSGDWRLATGETAIFLDGSAPALPKKIFCPKIELRTLHLAPDFGSPVGSPSHNAE